MLSTKTEFFLVVCKAMLLGTLILADTTPCTVSSSHAHALGVPQGPTYLPLGHTISILVGTNNIGNAHNA